MIGGSIQKGEWIHAVGVSVVMVLLAFIGLRISDNLLGKKKRKINSEIKKIHILLSEGSSLTSRETITSLKNEEYIIDILSSSKFPITFFSKWKRKLIPTVNINDNPKEYLNQVSRLINSGEYQALIPTHESAWLFSEGRKYLPDKSAIPVPSPEAFAKVQGKIAFAELSVELGIPHPEWFVLEKENYNLLPYPYWLKADYGTAGRSVYKVNNSHERELGITLLSDSNSRLMIQKDITGTYGQVQAVFNNGNMIAVHTTLQKGNGAGGSAAARISVDYPTTREHIHKIGSHLNWHGSLTLDFIFSGKIPYYIECNPRMIEPANAAISGVNFPKILIALATGKDLPNSLVIGKPGVKTHSIMALLLGTAESTKQRFSILKELWKCIRNKEEFYESTEVLTPFRKDPASIIPLIFILFRLLLSPEKVISITKHTVENYCVSPKTIAAIRNNNS